MKEYKAKNIARYVVFYCHKHRYAISNLKLQTILYFIQAYFLVSVEKPCFSDVIEAWEYGPIVPNAYKEYKIYGSLNIPCANNENEFSYIEDDDYDSLNRILAEISEYSTSRLVDIARNQSPWIDARKSVNNKITNKAIADYFNE